MVTRSIRLSVLALLLAATAAAAQSPGSLRFRFAFGAVTGTGNAQALQSITQDATLKSGDRLKLLVEMQQPGFVYVIYRAANNDLDLLYPGDLKPSAPVGQRRYIPDAAGWFKLDAVPGDETFYVVGSAQRLTELEAMLARHAAAPAAGKAAVGTEIVAEIRRLRTLHRNVNAPIERPVLIGGNVRALGNATVKEIPDLATIAVEITADGFYARTFTLTHK